MIKTHFINYYWLVNSIFEIEDILHSKLDEPTRNQLHKHLRLIKLQLEFLQNTNEEEIFSWEYLIINGLTSEKDEELFIENIEAEMKRKNVKDKWKFDENKYLRKRSGLYS